MRHEEDRFNRLNREFYSTKPHGYFRNRLILLGIRAVKTDALVAMTAEGLTWGQLRIGGGRQQEDETPEDEAAREEGERERFVVMESQILLHHASEALLRMFVAHADRPDCPWLDMAAINPNQFRDQVQLMAKSVWPQEWIDAAGYVFVGGLPVDPAPADWVGYRDAAVRLIRLLAKRLQDDKKLYNSAKHGLTALTSEGSVQMLSEGGEAMIGAEGVHVAYLWSEGSKQTGFTWSRTSQWVNPEQAAWETHLALRQMEALWTFARWHYGLDERPNLVELVTNEAIDAAITGFPRNSGNLMSFTQKVATETILPPQEQDTGD